MSVTNNPLDQLRHYFTQNGKTESDMSKNRKNTDTTLREQIKQGKKISPKEALKYLQEVNRLNPQQFNEKIKKEQRSQCDLIGRCIKIVNADKEITEGKQAAKMTLDISRSVVLKLAADPTYRKKDRLELDGIVRKAQKIYDSITAANSLEAQLSEKLKGKKEILPEEGLKYLEEIRQLDSQEFNKRIKKQQQQAIDLIGHCIKVVNNNPQIAHDKEVAKKTLAISKSVISKLTEDPTYRRKDRLELYLMTLKIDNALAKGIDNQEVEETPVDAPDPIGKTYRYHQLQGIQSPSTRLLFHIQGDEFGKNSELEGTQAFQTVSYLHTYAAKKGGAIAKDLIRELGDALVMDPHSGEFVKITGAKIQEAFAEKKPILLTGGWQGNPSGHAIYYEIIPESNDTASFRLYNTGAGIDNHHGVRVGNKEKSQAYCEWKGIKRDRLESKHFLEAIKELQTHETIPGTFDKTDYGEADVYQGLRILLKPNSEKTEFTKDPHLMMTPQRSGVCAWRSLMAFMRSRMNINDYKRFKYDIKLQSLTDWIDTSNNSLHRNITANEWRLVKKSHQKLCRSIIQAHQKGLVGDDYIHDAIKALRPVSEWLHKHADCRFAKAKGQVDFRYSPPHCGQIKNPHATDVRLEKLKQASVDSTAMQPCEYVFDAVKNVKVDDSSQIGTALAKIKGLAEKAWKNGNDQELYNGLIYTISNLKLDKNFWKKAVNNQASKSESMITQLGEISRLLLKSCLTVPQPEVIFSEKVYAFHKILFIQEMLCHLGHPNIDWGFYDKLSVNNLHLRFLDAHMHREMTYMDSNRPYNTLSRSLINNNYMTPRYPDRPGGYVRFKNDSDFARDIRKTQPKVIEKIAQNDPHFSRLPKNLQDAHIYMSNFLPEWIKGMRDASLASLFVEEVPLQRLTTLERDAHLNFGFSLKEEGKESCVVNIFLTGLISDGKSQHDRERYAGQYPEVENKSIKEFIDYLKGWEFPSDEKKLMVDHAKRCKVDMPDEEFKELAHLFLRSDLQLIETIEYFTKHPEKLKDRDYQTLLQVLLFKQRGLDDNLANKGFEAQLTHFVKSNYEKYKEENDIQVIVFLLKLARQLHGFCPSQPFFQNTLTKLHDLLNRKELEPEERHCIYTAIVAELGMKENLDNKEMAHLLAGSVYIQENRVNNKWKDPSLDKEARDAVAFHAKHMQKTLEDGKPNQVLLNRVLQLLRPGESNKVWKMSQKSGQFPVFSTDDGTHRYDPHLSQLISSQSQVLLPYTIRENPLFRALFPDTQYTSPSVNNVYSLTDSHGRETLVYMNKDNIVIDQKIDPKSNKWFRLVPSDTFLHEFGGELTSTIGSRHLVQHFLHWQSLENLNDVSLINLKNGKLEYQETFGEVRRTGDGAMLGRPSSLLDSFEDPSYIHEWYDPSHNLKQIELPRFGLNFTPQPNEKKLECAQFPDFYLNSTLSVPELGIHGAYIVIENEKGDRKVILPQQKIKSPQKKEVLLPRYELNQNLERNNSTPQKYYAYELQNNGRLLTKSREANLYLAHVLGALQEYKKAAYYLKKHGEKLSSYTSQEATILQDMTESGKVVGDQSGDGIALQLYAAYLLTKNSLTDHVDAKKVKNLQCLYKLYLEHYQNATVFKLEKEEELFILKVLLHHQFDAVNYLRLKEIDAAYARTLTLPAPKKIVPTANHETYQQYLDMPIIWPDQMDPPANEVLLTRASRALERHFLYYYEMARIGDKEQKAWLKEAINYSRFDDKRNGTVTALEAVLEKPNSFPAYKGDTSWDWQRAVRDAVEKTLAIRPKMPLRVANTIKGGDMTPKGFRFDPKDAPIPEVKVDYTMSKIASLGDDCISLKCFQEIAQVTNEKDGDSLSDWLKGIHSDDPLQTKELMRLRADLFAYREQRQVPQYTMKDQDVGKIKDLLSKDEKADDNKLQDLEKEIINLANKDPSSDVAKAQKQLMKLGQLRKVVTLDQLIVSFAKNHGQELVKRNPALNEIDLAKLFQLTGDYLLYATRIQQRKRAKTTLEKLESTLHKLEGKQQSQDLLEEKRDLINVLAQDLLAERVYNPAKSPAYLVFEYYAKLLMRPSQVEKLEKFLKSGDLNLVMEMIMGSGKSKVLLPLLGLLRADENTLSMLVVPQSLFESISSDTQSILQEAFDLSLKSLHFDRNTKFTKQSLEVILDQLKTIKKKGKCLIMTSKSIECLVLKFIEQSAERFNSGDKLKGFSDELKIMQKIIKILGKSGYPIIDEADTVLSVLHQVCFSIGERESPRQTDLELISEIYALLYESQEIRRLARLESDPKPEEGSPVLTEELYYDKVQKPLVSRLIQRLGTMAFESKGLTSKIHAFIHALTPKNRELLTHYLCRDKANIKAAQAYFDSLDKEIQDIVALAGEEIAHLLPHTLVRICEEKYGLDEENGEVLAIPYAAANAPNTGSQFANPHITMNYTFQTYIKKGISREMILRQVALLQEKAIRELSHGGDKMQLKDTLAWKIFCKLKGDCEMPLFNFKPGHIDDVVIRVNRSLKAKREFVSSVVLPQMELYEQKMSCNSHNLIALFNKVSGFTGTLWNGTSMHRKLQPAPEIGTDAKTLSILWNKSRVTTLKEGSTQDMFTQLKQKNISFDMVGDAGGYFKDGSNGDIAHRLRLLYGKEVVFYNGQGEQRITDGEGDMPLLMSNLTEEERLTFLDQIRTTGADVKQKRNAVGIVTIGRTMLMRDLLQAVWRLRGLDKSQSVHFVMTEEVEAIIRQKLNLDAKHAIQFKEIVLFTIGNQSLQQGRDNFKALMEELASIPQQILLDVLLDENLIPKDHWEAFTKLHSHWIKAATQRPKDLYGTLVEELESDRVVKLVKEKSLAEIKEIFTKIPWLETIGIREHECLSEVEKIVSRMKGSLPSYVIAKDREDESTVEVEQETQRETETELQVDELPETDTIDLGIAESRPIVCAKEVNSVTLKTDSQLPAFSLKSYFKHDKALSPYANAFDDVYATLNVAEYTKKGPTASDLKFLGSHRTPLHHLVIRNSQVIAMSHYEAQTYRTSPEYYNLTLGYTDSTRKPSLEELGKIVKLKFLNGEAQYNKVEIELLKNWFKANGPEKMRTLYREHILSGYPQKASKYLDSPLQHLFAEMTSTV